MSDSVKKPARFSKERFQQDFYQKQQQENERTEEPKVGLTILSQNTHICTR